MKIMLLAMLIFLLGFCFGGLYGLKIADETNERWTSLAMQINEDWKKHCETLIEKIKILERSDSE